MIHKKQNVSLHEYNMYKYVYNLQIIQIPRIIYYNKKSQILYTEKINNMCIADLYGEQPENIDNDLFEKCQLIIKKLYKYNILYRDITAYNFIEDNNIVWLIDFEHCCFKTNKYNDDEDFIKKFINGLNEWNPNFL